MLEKVARSRTVTDRNNIEVSYEAYTYDENGNTLLVTDGNRNVTRYTYDAANRVLSETLYDRNGSFVRWLFKWARQHGRTRMLIYYRSVVEGSPCDISQFPSAEKVLRQELNSKRFMQYPPGTKKHHHHHRHQRS